MRLTTTLILTALLAVLGCAKAERTESVDHTPEAESAPVHDTEMPDDDLHRMPATMPEDEAHAGVMGGGDHDMGVNTEIRLDATIESAWSGIRVRLEEIDGGRSEFFDVPLGESLTLGDSGISLAAVLFIPDFVMDDDGITSRSAEPVNPAARVIITESGREPHEGWLFAAMPAIHAYPHERYKVLLEAGIPARDD